ncbi:hypothetical protein [Pseudoalteromonas sp. Of7M-16]|uniref:hypothetical protein n=1 Tax=Pseudoalteromonas sp. Of7M-16 TaxID=2917756 RepID=UPI001EF6032C|nr:hypothetical protein [Pseudoalteromonas sp. Of7M-16]MCG7550962.1 hypothetical protein [Pseudoalteromonas sp. Of7M-16]
METIRLQAIGYAKAKRAEDLQVGDVTVWNYGATEKLIEKVKETAKTVTFKVLINGRTFERRMNKNRLVGINS